MSSIALVSTFGDWRHVLERQRPALVEIDRHDRRGLDLFGQMRGPSSPAAAARVLRVGLPVIAAGCDGHPSSQRRPGVIAAKSVTFSASRLRALAALGPERAPVAPAAASSFASRGTSACQTFWQRTQRTDRPFAAQAVGREVVGRGAGRADDQHRQNRTAEAPGRPIRRSVNGSETMKPRDGSQTVVVLRPKANHGRKVPSAAQISGQGRDVSEGGCGPIRECGPALRDGSGSLCATSPSASSRTRSSS